MRISVMILLRGSRMSSSTCRLTLQHGPSRRHAMPRSDLLVSIGGGSATGLAKAVARDTGLPILAVPTTYAGSEMTPIWGQTDHGEKTTGRDPRVLPRLVVYDPVLTISMPADLTAASGMNAWRTHWNRCTHLTPAHCRWR